VRRAARIDCNQFEIVQAFRTGGASVKSLASVGEGCPDLLVGYRGRNHLVEVKDGKKFPCERKLTPDQEKFHKEWKVHIYIAESIDDVFNLINQWAADSLKAAK